MTTILQKTEQKDNSLLASNASYMDDEQLLSVLRNSIYPGARDDSIKLVIAYCRARNLDPLQKPVHIVAMKVKKKGSHYDCEWRDVIMPGIGLYRIQAARSGAYAGVSEPEFGEDIKETIGDTAMAYPSWCRVTVFRALSSGQIVGFTAKELWKENYATASGSTRPNSMWARRPYAQLAKCAEAQALRKAFPEFGSAPTAEEMEGQTEQDEGESTAEVSQPLKPPVVPQAISNAPASQTIDAVTGEIVSGQPVAKERRRRPIKAAAAAPAPEQATTTHTLTQQVQEQQHKAVQQQTPLPPPPLTIVQKGIQQMEYALQAQPPMQADPLAQPGMLNFLRSKAKSKNITEQFLCEKGQLSKLEDATVAMVNDLIEWLRQQP